MSRYTIPSLSLVVYAFVCAAGYLLVLRPMVADLQKSNAASEQERVIKDAFADAQKAGSPTALALLKANSTKASLLERAPGLESTLFENVTAFVSRNELTLQRIEQLPTQAKDHLLVLPLQLEVAGTFDNIVALIDSVKDQPRLLRVVSVKMTRQNIDAKSDAAVDASIVIEAYGVAQQSGGSL